MKGISLTGGNAWFDPYKVQWQLLDIDRYEMAREHFDYAFNTIAKTIRKEVKKLTNTAVQLPDNFRVYIIH